MFIRSTYSPRSPYYCAGEIAQMLNRCVDWFYRHRAELHGKGLPLPVDLPGQRRWHRHEVDMWLFGKDRRDLAGRETLPQDMPANDARPVDLSDPLTIEEFQNRLALRYRRA